MAVHDYYVDSVYVWGTLDREITAGRREFSYRNPATGTATTQTDLLARIPGYVEKRLRIDTFQTFLTIFEAFLADVVRAWLRAYPHALADKSPVPAEVVLDAPDRDAILDFLIDRAVGGLFYRRPADWFAYLDKQLKLGTPTTDEVERLAEAKATRDVLVHNRGEVNELYVRKAGARARHVAGELVDVPDLYHHETWELMLKVAADLSAALLARVP